MKLLKQINDIHQLGPSNIRDKETQKHKKWVNCDTYINERPVENLQKNGTEKKKKIQQDK